MSFFDKLDNFVDKAKNIVNQVDDGLEIVNDFNGEDSTYQENQEQLDQQEEQEIEEDSKAGTYFIIGGSVLIVLLGIGIFFALRKKKA